MGCEILIRELDLLLLLVKIRPVVYQHTKGEEGPTKTLKIAHLGKKKKLIQQSS